MASTLPQLHDTIPRTFAAYLASPAIAEGALAKFSASILLLGRFALGATLRAPRVSSIASRNSSSLSAQLSSATKMASESVHYDLLVRPP